MSPHVDIGGLDDVVESMKEAVLYPLQYPSLFNRPSGLLAAPKGVLLYGPPGRRETRISWFDSRFIGYFHLRMWQNHVGQSNCKRIRGHIYK